MTIKKKSSPWTPMSLSTVAIVCISCGSMLILFLLVSVVVYLAWYRKRKSKNKVKDNTGPVQHEQRDAWAKDIEWDHQHNQHHTKSPFSADHHSSRSLYRVENTDRWRLYYMNHRERPREYFLSNDPPEHSYLAGPTGTLQDFPGYHTLEAVAHEKNQTAKQEYHLDHGRFI